jgi:hypothetical protein
MEPSLTDYLGNPAILTALTSALIAAAVAVFVLAVSQYLIFKKGRTDFLTPKLEELYLLLNEVSEHNVTQFTLHFNALNGDTAARKQLADMDDLDIYGQRRAKKIIMYVRLYFPTLSRAHQRVFTAERQLNTLRHGIVALVKSDPKALIADSGEVGRCLMLMEQELIENRDLLLRANVFPRFYRSASAAQIAASRPPLPGDPFAPSPEPTRSRAPETAAQTTNPS